MLLILVPLILVPSRASADLAFLTGDADLARQISEAEEKIRNGDVEGGLPVLQELHETSFTKNRVLLSRSLEDVRVSSVQYVIRLLRDLGQDPAFVEAYRKKYDLAANALVARADRDASALLHAYELYPLSTVAFDVALTAGDLFFEADQPLRAREAWEWISTDNLPSDDQQKLARRWVLLAAHTGDTRLHKKWWDELEGLPGGSPESLPKAPKTEVDPLASLPPLPFLTGKKSGGTAGQFAAARRMFDDPRSNHYTQEVGIVGDWVAVTTLKKLRFFDPAMGLRAVREETLPRIKRRRVDGDRGRRSFEYQEYDRNVRLRPVAGEGYILTSYVYDANPQQKYVGYLIRESIPRRSLKAFHTQRRGEVWDSRDCKDEVARDLSYRSRPVIHNGKVYALGWRWAGLIDSYLVCFDLATGKMQWKTAVVGNQVDLTMFGEINSEPFLGDVLVEGGLVFVQTNLGAVAALRAWDGHTLWVTPYPAIEVPPARQRQNKILRPQTFQPSPIISYQDRIIVAPLDSNYSLTLHKETGQQLMRRKGRRGEFLVGLWGDSLIYCHRRAAVKVTARDISGRGQYFPLSADVNAMPALVQEGLVFSSPDGVYLQRFRSDEPSQLIVATPPERGSRRVPRLDGAVTIFKDKILVTNSYRVQSFEGPRKQLPVPR